MKRFSLKTLAIIGALLMLFSSVGTIMATAAPRIQILPSAGNNLLVGGDFEEGDTTSWSFVNADFSAAAAYNSSFGAALHIEPTVSTSLTYIFDQAALAPNSTYALKADINVNGADNLDVAFQATTGDATVHKVSIPKDSSWHHDTTLITITTGVEYVCGRLILSAYKGADKYIYVDNLYMEANGDEWCPTPTGRMTIGEYINDDFNGTELDKDVWLVSNTAWGGANGGLNSANVKLDTVDGRSVCVLESHGDEYEGNVQGVGQMTHRVGAGIVTRDYYASARYTVVCKIEPQLGVCTAFWSFSYIGYMQTDEDGDGRADTYDEGDKLWQYNKANNISPDNWILENGVRNSEIDWETPSPMDNGGANDVVSHNNLRTNCWGGKRPGEGGNYSGRSHQNNDATVSIADGEWHELVYEWFGLDNPYTSEVNDPAVIWFIDGLRVDGYDINNIEYQKCDSQWHGQTYHAPDGQNFEPSEEQVIMGPLLAQEFKKGIEVPRYGTRFWLATWFPVKDDKLYCVGQSAYTGWAGTPDYDTTYTYLDRCEILPYTNGGTSYQGNLPVKAQYLGDDGIDLGDEYDGVIESVPNKQFALPTEYPNYAENNGLLPAPEIRTEESGSTVTVSWDAVSGATGYDLAVDGRIISNATSPYNVTGLYIGNHTFKLRSKSGNNPSIWGREALVSVGTPKNVEIEVVGHSMVVTWDDVEGAVEYYMEIDNKPMIVNDAFVSFTSGDDDCGWLQGLSTGSTHMVRVKAVGVKGTSNWSSLRQATITAAGVPIPSLVLKGSDTDIHAFMAIIDRVAGATAYQIKDMNDNIIDVPINQWGYPTKDFENFAPGIYYYRARAYKDGEWSDWSSTQSIAIAPDEILQAPGIHVSSADNSSIDIYWNEIAEATRYDLEVDDVVIIDAGLSYKHTGLEAGTTHKYRVRAVNDSQTGPWSSYAYGLVGSDSGGGGGGGGGQQYSGNGTIQNGEFDSNMDYWDTDGQVSWNDGSVTMTAGDMTAVLSQTVFGCKANTTYTFNADITGNSNLYYIYIRNTNGQKNELSTRNLPYTFTTGDISSEDGITFIFSVYKQQTGSITIDNVNLSEGTVVTQPTVGSTTTRGSMGPTSSTTKKPTTTTTRTTTTTTTKAPTTTTTVNYGDAWMLSLNVTEYVPDKWSSAQRNENYLYNKGATAHLAFHLPDVWHSSGYQASAIQACFSLNLNGTPITPTTCYGTDTDLVAEFDFVMDGNKTLSGTISHPDFKAFVLDINAGQGTITTTTTNAPTTTTTTKAPTTTTTTKAPVVTTTTTKGASGGLLGDCNNDGSIDMKDVLLLRRFVAGVSVTIYEDLANVNPDDSLDMKDVLKLRRMVAGVY